MSARNLVALAGGIIGFLVAGPAGFSFGYTLGALVGSILFPPDPIKGPRLEDLEVQVSGYGVAIPRCWGWVRLAGNMIWATDIIEHKRTHTEGGLFGLGGTTYVDYSYTGNFSIALCEGPIALVKRIWADGKIIWEMDLSTGVVTSNYKDYITVVLGSESELPSAMMEQYDGVGNVPGYRGIARVDFEGLPLKNFGNRIPNFNFEIFAGTATVTAGSSTNPSGDLSKIRYDTRGDLYVSISGGVMVIQSVPEFEILATVNLPSGLGDNVFITAGGHIAVSNNDGSRVAFYNSTGSIVGDLGGDNHWLGFGNGGFRGWAEYTGMVGCETGTFLGLIVDNNLRIMVDEGQSESTTFNRCFPYDTEHITATAPFSGVNPPRGMAMGPGNVYALRVGFGANAVVVIPWVGIDGNYCETLPECDGPTHLGGGGETTYTVHDPPSGSSGTMAGIAYLNDTDEVLIVTSNGIFVYDSSMGSVQRSVTGDWTTSATAYLANRILSDNGTVLIYESGTGDVWEYDVEDLSLVRHILATDNGWPTSGNTVWQYNYTHQVMIVGGILSTGPHALFLPTNVYDSTISLASIVRDINVMAGLVEGTDFDVSGLDADVTGYYVNQESSARQMIEPLQGVYFFDGIESGGKLYYRHRNQTSLGTIAQKDMGSYGGGETPPPIITEVRTQELELPAEVTVKYPSRALNYNQNAQKSRRAFETQKAEQRITVDVPITMKDEDAKIAADVLLLDSWVTRNSYEFSVPRSYIQYDPGDVVTLSYDDIQVEVYIRTIDFGADGLLKMTAVAHDVNIYSGTGIGPNVPDRLPPTDNGDVIVPSQAFFDVVDGPLILPAMDDYTGYFVFAEGYAERTNPVNTWPGGDIWEGFDGTPPIFDPVTTIRAESILGFCVDPLGTHSTHCLIDNTNTLDVIIHRGELSSITWTEMMSDNRLNWAFVKDDDKCELIQFQTAELLSDNPITYRLSGLRRGMLGTDWAMNMHTAGELFIFINFTTMTALPLPMADYGTTHDYVIETFNDSDDRYSLWDNGAFVERQNNAAHLRCLSPTHFLGEINGTDDWELSWERRARMNTEWDDSETELDEDTELYEIDIYDGDTVVRTISVTGATTATYTAAQQTTDFGSLQTTLRAIVYQISTHLSGTRGYPCERTF